MRMSPVSKLTSRFTILSAVVLPPPDGPTRTQNVPAGISNERSSSAAASRPAYRFVTWSKVISAALLVTQVPDSEQPDRPADGEQRRGDPHRHAVAAHVEPVVLARDRCAHDG